MWSLSSLRRPFSSSLLGNLGGLNFISYMSSRYAAFTPGGLGNHNEISHPNNVPRGESEKQMFPASGNLGRNMQNVSDPIVSKFQSFYPSTGRLGNRNEISHPDNVPRGESEKQMFQSSGNFGTNVQDPIISKFSSFYPSTSRNGVETPWTDKPMDIVRKVISDDISRPTRYNVENNADIVHIKLRRNNAFVNVTDSKGNTKLRASSGFKDVSSGGKVGRYAAEATAEYAGRKARDLGLKSFVVKVNGFTYFKKKRQAIMSFREGFANSRTDKNPIMYIEDSTRRPHNGCRLPKKRRI